MATDATPAAIPRPVGSDLSRDYVAAALASLVVVFLCLLLRGTVTVAAGAAVLGMLGLVFRSAFLSTLFLVAVGYLLVYPFGIPGAGAGFAETRRTVFRVQDFVMVGATSAFLLCTFRSFAFRHHAMPADGPASAVAPSLRQTGDDGEFARVLLTLTGCLLVGQLAWLALTNLTLNLRAFPPIRLATDRDFFRPDEFAMPLPLARVLLLGGAAILGGLLARFAFWYWWLARLNPDEARVLLQDAVWREMRRESSRQEKWRGWALTRGRPRRRVPPEPRRWRFMHIVFLVLVAVAVVVWARAALSYFDDF